jgi:23S rRNA G2445 N2-methylase RlmL
MRKLTKPHKFASTLIKSLKHSTTTLTFEARNAQVSIDVHITDAFITVGLALSSASQASRGQEHGLRSTTAAAMAMCLTLDTNLDFFKKPIRPGDIVLDPMCGKGSILGAFENQKAVILGVDNSAEQIKLAQKNHLSALLVYGDARRLPLEEQSVDFVVCDLPFGLKYNKGDFKELIPSVLGELRRVIKISGQLVLLFARSERELLEKWGKECGFMIIKTFDVMLGILEAKIFVFCNNDTENKLT